jgi:hypothetical protein
MKYLQLFLLAIHVSEALEITVVERVLPIPKLENLPIIGGPPTLQKFDNNVRRFATKASQITIFLEGLFYKPLYLIETVMDLYPTWLELSKSVNLEIIHVFSMVRLFFDLSYFIIKDMVFLIRELEFLVEWFIRDWEDLLYPWIVYQTRSRGLKILKVFLKLCAVKILIENVSSVFLENRNLVHLSANFAAKSNQFERPLADELIFPYTGYSSGIFTIIGNFSYQLSAIIRKMAKDVLTWINNFTNRPFKFSFITAITRNFREWIELLQRETRILLKETTQLLEIEFDASFWTFYIFESVLIVIDLADEMLELANLSLGKSLRIQTSLR